MLAYMIRMITRSNHESKSLVLNKHRMPLPQKSQACEKRMGCNIFKASTSI
jgi:hypothetical protein